MSKITSYTALTTTATDDVLPIVDVHDTTMAPTGTTKQITVANLLPAATTSAAGVVILDGTSGDIQASPGTAAAGNKGQAADAKHVHPSPAAFAPAGLTGATSASRYAGATASGAPSSGTFAIGDYVIDQTGKIWICTTAGTPGTWAQVSGGGTSGLTPVSVKTTTYNAAAGDLVPCDTTSAAFPVNLPAAPADKTLVLVKLVIQGTGNNVTINCGGADVIDKAAGVTSTTLSVPGQVKLFQYKAAGAIWYVTGADLPLSQLDLRYGATAASVTWSSATPAAIGPGAASPADAYIITLGAAITTITLTAAAAPAVQALTLYIQQPPSGTTNYTVSGWPGTVTWLAGGSPTVATGANALTLIVLETPNAGTNWYGSVITGSPSLPLTVPNGGTGTTTLTGLITGNGTSAMTAVTAPAGTVVGTTDTQTLTGKRISPRVNTLTVSAATYTPAGDTTDLALIASPAANFTMAAPTGTPADGQKLGLRITSGGTGFTPTWNAIYLSSGVATLPSAALPASKTVTLGFQYDANAAKWVLLALDGTGY